MPTLPIISQITGNLLRTTKWDVQVLKSQKEVIETDNLLIEAKHLIENSVTFVTDAIQDLMIKWFGGNKRSEIYETIGEFDTFISFNGVHDSQLVQNTVERGSFRSVNKIRKPNSCIVELGRGGTEAEIELTLRLLKRYQGGTHIMRVLTPYGYISNLNLNKLEYQYRKGSGANMLIARLHFQEIMYGSSAGYTTKKVSTPDKTNTSNGGLKALQGK